MPNATDAFTPVPETLVYECGPITALVWGVVWRYCQMGDGRCSASQAALARRAGVCRETVCRHLRTLIEAGYLADLSPDALPGQPHTYAVTPRVRLAPLAQLGLCAPAPQRPRRTNASRVCTPAPELPPRAAGGDAYDDRLYERDDGADHALLVELLAEHFCRLTGIPQPRPRDENELRAARALWADPLRRIAASCGCAAEGRRAIAAAVAILRYKNRIVSAPASIVGTAEALAARQRARRP